MPYDNILLKHDGICIYCHDNYSDFDVSGCSKCLFLNRSNYLAIKMKLITKYGGKCACCNITELQFLTIDHIYSDGYRRERLNYIQLLNMPIDPTLQVMCRNCNSGKARNNCSCPHNGKRKEISEIKETIFSHYGNMCSCCGEAEHWFLDIDHIDNNGGNFRKKNPLLTSNKYYNWIIETNFPSDLQLLCQNCNWSKFLNGLCIHNKIINTKEFMEEEISVVEFRKFYEKQYIFFEQEILRSANIGSINFDISRSKLIDLFTNFLKTGQLHKENLDKTIVIENQSLEFTNEKVNELFNTENFLNKELIRIYDDSYIAIDAAKFPLPKDKKKKLLAWLKSQKIYVENKSIRFNKGIVKRCLLFKKDEFFVKNIYNWLVNAG